MQTGLGHILTQLFHPAFLGEKTKKVFKVGHSRLQILGAVWVNCARNGSSTPQRKGLWEVTEAKEKLPVPVRLQMASLVVAIRADLLQNARQASPSWFLDSW